MDRVDELAWEAATIADRSNHLPTHCTAQRALAIAECQSAKLFSLRAATDLAGLLHETGRAEEAISILQPVHNWFSRGWDYPDLQRARAMLDKIKV